MLFDKGQGRCPDHVYFPVPWLQGVVCAAQTLNFLSYGVNGVLAKETATQKGSSCLPLAYLRVGS